MIVTGVVIQTLSGAAGEVARSVDGTSGLEVQGDDGNQRVAALWRAVEGSTLETLSELLVASNERVLGVFPVYVSLEGGGP